jgi:DNA-binding MurR/RpiR family transcriptional regulator
MNSRASENSTLNLVAAVSRELTPTERRIAEAVLAEPTLLAFGTVSDLADRVGTSRPSIVRFANKLGFQGYSLLQQHVRSDLSQQLSRPSERIRQDDKTGPPIREVINGGIASVLDAFEDGRIAELAAPVVQAEKVWILSGETSQAGAHALYSGLSMVRPRVRALEEHSFATDLSDAGPQDVAVVFDFYRYRRQVVTATRVLANVGVNIIVVSDSPLSPLVELADSWCQIEVPAIGPFDSSAPIVLMCELLVARVAQELKDDAKSRIDQIEALWKDTDAFV